MKDLIEYTIVTDWDNQFPQILYKNTAYGKFFHIKLKFHYVYVKQGVLYFYKKTPFKEL